MECTYIVKFRDGLGESVEEFFFLVLRPVREGEQAFIGEEGGFIEKFELRARKKGEGKAWSIRDPFVCPSTAKQWVNELPLLVFSP